MKTYHLTSKGHRWEFSEEAGCAIATFDSKQEGMNSFQRITDPEDGLLKIHLPDGSIELGPASPGPSYPVGPFN
ncbi:MAG TPA: hypothetical protein VHM91_23070 [Verrucomicrobiales bacterium]|jgi:hypothetical protein|nr:hypothetical protein [Verrucomicrobiales bacterium]